LGRADSEESGLSRGAGLRSRPLFAGDSARNYYNAGTMGLTIHYTLSAPARPHQSRRRWSKQRLIDGIQQRQRAGLPLTQRVAEKEDSGLVAATRRHFGGWTQALAAAGVSTIDDQAPSQES
jgi:hypothetical protein